MFWRIFLLPLAACVLLSGAEVTLSVGDALARMPAAERSEVVRKGWQATTLNIPEGNITLSAVVQILAATGNDTTIASGVDGNRAEDFPGFSGDWWSGVLLVCETFALEPAPGQEVGSEDIRGRGPDYGQTLPATAGPLVLAAHVAGSAMPPRQVCGPLLIEMPDVKVTGHEGSDEFWADLSLRVRVEPHFAPRSIGRIAVRWNKAMAGDAPVVVQANDRPMIHGARLHLTGLPAQAGHIFLTGGVTVSALAPLHVEAQLQPGDTAHIDLGDQSMVLKLLNSEQARLADKRTACAVLTYPASALSGAPEVSVSVDGQILPIHGSRISQNGGECEQTGYFNALADVPHLAAIDAMQPLGEVAIPLAIDLDLSRLPDTPIHADGDMGTDIATTIVLPGGELALDDAITLLRGGGNSLVVDLGVDGRAKATLPPARLGFWDAALAVSKAFKLDLMPPQSITINDSTRNQRSLRIARMQQMSGFDSCAGDIPLYGGPVGLGRIRDDSLRPLSRVACGPLLVEVVRIERTTLRTLSGSARNANIQVRIRLEPRIARELVTSSQLVWSSAASDETGGRLAVKATDVEGRGIIIDGMEGAETRTDEGLHSVTVEGLATKSHRFTLTGQVLLRLQRPVRCETLLEVGGPVSPTRLGQIPVSISLVTAANDDQGVRLVYSRTLGEDLQVTVRGPDGIEMMMRGRNSRGDGQHQTDTWHVSGLQPATRYTVVVTSSEIMETPVIALSVPIELP